jgi:hypothetical protein
MAYPSIRTRDAPDFIAEKYGDLRGLLAEVARWGEMEGLPAFDVEKFLAAIPTVDDAFAADAEKLRIAFAVPDEQGNRYRMLIQRLMIWKDLDELIRLLRNRYDHVIGQMPRKLLDIEEGGGGRDVLDPFLVAFASRLLHSGSISAVVGTLVAHKCLMKLEDLIGHLHQEVMGRAAGGECIPEPQGVIDAESGKRNKEDWNAVLNPYPGADARREQEEFYQIKNKTGSAKGSDGEKLGRQFQILKEKYPGCERYYVSMIGRTLRGHRSMGAFLRKDPEAEVLVGLAAWQQLGRHRDTPSIVMELCIEEFEAALARNHYGFQTIVDEMTKEWIEKHGTGDPGFRLLEDSITPVDRRDQTSKTYGKKILTETDEPPLPLSD